MFKVAHCFQSFQRNGKPPPPPPSNDIRDHLQFTHLLSMIIRLTLCLYRHSPVRWRGNAKQPEMEHFAREIVPAFGSFDRHFCRQRGLHFPGPVLNRRTGGVKWRPGPDGGLPCLVRQPRHGWLQSTVHLPQSPPVRRPRPPLFRRAHRRFRYIGSDAAKRRCHSAGSVGRQSCMTGAQKARGAHSQKARAAPADEIIQFCRARSRPTKQKQCGENWQRRRRRLWRGGGVSGASASRRQWVSLSAGRPRGDGVSLSEIWTGHLDSRLWCSDSLLL